MTRAIDDQATFDVVIWSDAEELTIRVRGSDLSDWRRYWREVDRFLEDGDCGHLDRVSWVTLRDISSRRTHHLETRPNVVYMLASIKRQDVQLFARLISAR
jgi:hypothetical protein